MQRLGGRQLSNLNSSSQALIEHWDGANWTVVPNPDTGSAVLNAAAASSATDVWAVGEDSSSGSGQNLIEHWNGSAWSVVPSPSVPNALLSGVTATSATNAWAVGVTETSSTVKTVVEHWNGTAWSIVPSPNPGSIDNEPASVTATSKTNAWMVGSFRNSDPATHEFIAHWDGTAWTQVPSPSQGSSSQLLAVAGPATSGSWSVGRFASSTGPAEQAFALHCG